ncbi:GNAT family N-acetyltransferase [Streptomyces beijiangensis]|uniref:GNAT family N-acetyltransferase n=1 Tax=Streptomyces beijiangensis TaxID=163361 RepID=A0A939FAZ7_9ACTN|nr:GNAT family protein [Streptomyces beijiangensis]MBO0515287.1 GNAT family N-acetyltransferase [Streptomyces beijiangensis]
MMRGKRIGLRARHETDVPIFQAELYNDVVTRSGADSRPWRPVTPKAAEAAEPPDADTATLFTVVELDDAQTLLGEALLWGIDTHNRTAHLGISLLPTARGRGFGTDVVRLLCEYGFEVRGLHRLQVETLADNASMIAAAMKAGFTVDGTLRKSAWVYGAFADEVILGLLAEEWRPRPKA